MRTAHAEVVTVQQVQGEGLQTASPCQAAVQNEPLPIEAFEVCHEKYLF